MNESLKFVAGLVALSVLMASLVAGITSVRAMVDNQLSQASELRQADGLVDSWQGMARELRIQLHDICLDHPKHSSCVWLKDDYDQRG